MPFSGKPTGSVKAPIQIDTARLILRQPQMSDAAAIFGRYAGDSEVTRFLGWPRHRTVRDTEAFLQFSAQEWERWPAGPYLILSRTDGQLLGSTGLMFQAAHEAATGYVLAKDAWGKGYATEALSAIIDVAPRIGVTRLEALCHPEHSPSRHVLEKCGFTNDGHSTRRTEFPNLSPGVQQKALCYVLVLETEKHHADVRLPGI
jgi:ribosomal-protein-alanine N-acetyltransferase